MKWCKVKPGLSICRDCMDMADSCGAITQCATCNSVIEGELMQVGVSFLHGAWAIIRHDGKLKQVSLDSVYDVKEIGR